MDSFVDISNSTISLEPTSDFIRRKNLSYIHSASYNNLDRVVLETYDFKEVENLSIINP